MKTLILNGSPRKNGDTAQLLELAKAQLQGTYYVVSAYTADIHPCIDCRHCQKQFGCIFADEMEAVYTYLKDCDRILLASPIYFSELTGSLLNVISRLQPYFYARYFRKEPIPLHIQKAVTVLVGGGTGSPKKAYDTAEQLDSLLYNELHFAFDRSLGFLTECPTNLGTGLRASVMLHLPVTESNGEISSIAETVGKIGFTVRGMYGEGTKASASMYQVSNQITLGISEKNAIDNLKIITAQLIDKERKARNGLNKIKLEDMCFRALGTLQNSRILSSKEMMDLLSRIKLGISMGIIKTDVLPIKLFIEGQPNMLMKKYGQLEPEERDIYRAAFIRDALK